MSFYPKKPHIQGALDTLALLEDVSIRELLEGTATFSFGGEELQLSDYVSAEMSASTTGAYDDESATASCDFSSAAPADWDDARYYGVYLRIFAKGGAKAKAEWNRDFSVKWNACEHQTGPVAGDWKIKKNGVPQPTTGIKCAFRDNQPYARARDEYGFNSAKYLAVYPGENGATFTGGLA